MSDWIYERQVANAEKHWKHQAEKKKRPPKTPEERAAKRQRRQARKAAEREANRNPGIIVTRVAAPYPAVHPIPVEIMVEMSSGRLR